MIAFLSISEAVTPPAPISSERTTSTYEGIITMTTTGEDTRPLPLIGQAVGQAQASLTRLLTGILAGSGTSYLLWLGLQRLNTWGGQRSRARETNTTEGNR